MTADPNAKGLPERFRVRHRHQGVEFYTCPMARVDAVETAECIRRRGGTEVLIVRYIDGMEATDNR